MAPHSSSRMPEVYLLSVLWRVSTVWKICRAHQVPPVKQKRTEIGSNDELLFEILQSFLYTNSSTSVPSCNRR